MTAQFELLGLTKRYGGATIVDALDLTIDEGELLVLLGPSGCGKTTTLRCLAGLETPEAGSITFRGRTVFAAERNIHVPPHRRNIGMVFQSYALWPNMTVRENIRYPLKVRGMKKALSSGRVEDAAKMVDCAALLDRYPAQLSGGQQQRVAVARGLVAEPDLVLFDEPLSNLDARLRDQVRTEIHQLHQRQRFTGVFVTHDQSEAFALGDKIAIMRSGRIEQYGTPEEVYENPSSDYVAAFVGMSNQIPLVRGADGLATLAGTPVPVRPPVQARELVARLRPEDVVLYRTAQDAPPGRTVLNGELVTSEYGGRHYDLVVRAEAQELHLRAEAALHGSWLRSAAPGEPLAVGWDPAALRLYPAPGAEPAPTPEPTALPVSA